jgi:pyruvate kinase
VRHTQADSELQRLIDEFKGIRDDMLRLVEDSADLLQDVHPKHQLSARNLLHYLALRSHDLRAIQAQLSAAGLSSLGRAESHVLAAVETVLDILERLCDSQPEVVFSTPKPIDRATGQQLLTAHTEAVLGPAQPRGVAIMVTMPSEAAEDYTLVSDLLQQGMNCMRINCAHDGLPNGHAWSHTCAERKSGWASLAES